MLCCVEQRFTGTTGRLKAFVVLSKQNLWCRQQEFLLLCSLFVIPSSKELWVSKHQSNPWDRYVGVEYLLLQHVKTCWSVIGFKLTYYSKTAGCMQMAVYGLGSVVLLLWILINWNRAAFCHLVPAGRGSAGSLSNNASVGAAYCNQPEHCGGQAPHNINRFAYTYICMCGGNVYTHFEEHLNTQTQMQKK